MESRPPVAAKRLRSYLRVALFMIRKGLTSKRKLIMNMNLMMKRGKFISKGLGNLVFHHHQPHRRSGGLHYGMQDYEFSFNTSPSPIFFHTKRATRHRYFPCLGVVAVDEDVPPPPACSFAGASFPTIHYSPELDPPAFSPSPSSVSVSDCDDEEKVVSCAASPETNEVDDEAELFIRRFYEQLCRQRHVALLQYELDYQDMLTRSH